MKDEIVSYNVFGQPICKYKDTNTPRDKENIIEKSKDINKVLYLDDWLQNSHGNVMSINQKTSTGIANSINDKKRTYNTKASTNSDYSRMENTDFEASNDSANDLFYYTPQTNHRNKPENSNDSIKILNDEINVSKENVHRFQDCIDIDAIQNTQEMVNFHLTTPQNDNTLKDAIKERNHFLDVENSEAMNSNSRINYSMTDHEKVIWLVANNRDNRDRSFSRGSDTIREIIECSRENSSVRKGNHSFTSRTRDDSHYSAPSYYDLLKNVNQNKKRRRSTRNFENFETFNAEADECSEDIKGTVRRVGLTKLRRKFESSTFKETQDKLIEHKGIIKPPNFNKTGEHLKLLYGDKLAEETASKQTLAVKFGQLNINQTLNN